MKEPIYVALTGTQHYFGTDFLKIGQVVSLIKDPENRYDDEAIKAEITPIGKIGYVANSPYTVPRGCRSAGRIYDSFDNKIFGIVRFVVKETVILELKQNVEEVYIVKIMDENTENYLTTTLTPSW